MNDETLKQVQKCVGVQTLENMFTGGNCVVEISYEIIVSGKQVID